MKKKKTLLIIIPILLVLLAAAVLALLYLTTDMFKTNDVLFAKYFMQNEELLNIIQNENLNNQTDLRKTNTYKSEGELTVSIDDGTNIQEINATTATRYDADTKRTYSEIKLKNSEEDLLKVSFINSDDVYAIKCDDILGNYIGIRNSNLKTFAKNMGMSDEEIEFIPNSIELNALNEFLEITEEQKQHIINTYSTVITENISKDKFTKVQDVNIGANNMNYKAIGYTLSIDKNTINNMKIDFLNKLKDDNITLALLSNKLSMFGIDDENLDITNLSKALNEAVTKMQKEVTKNEEIIKITVYVYKGKTIRNEILVFENGKEIGGISIDISDNNNAKRANITVKDIDEPNSFSTDTEDKIIFSKITLEKTITDKSIINKMMYIPDSKNPSEYTSTEMNIEKIQNNIANNTSKVTISTAINENTAQKTTALYTQNIQLTSQIEEIMELKNSNTVILNNYSLEQLSPFLTNLGNKIEQVIPNKIEQLGVGTNVDSGEIASSEITDMSTSMIQLARAAVVGGSCIANVNKNLTEFGANVSFSIATCATKILVMLNENTYNSMLESQQRQDEAEQELEKYNANTEIYIDEYINSAMSNNM